MWKNFISIIGTLVKHSHICSLAGDVIKDLSTSWSLACPWLVLGPVLGPVLSQFTGWLPQLQASDKQIDIWPKNCIAPFNRKGETYPRISLADILHVLPDELDHRPTSNYKGSQENRWCLYRLQGHEGSARKKQAEKHRQRMSFVQGIVMFATHSLSDSPKVPFLLTDKSGT